jgi:hypothetical protein
MTTGALLAASRPKAGSEMVRWGQGWRRGSRTMTGALPVASRPKAGSATGLARWRGIEGGGSADGNGVGDNNGGTAGGVEAEGGVDNRVGAASREAAEAPREGTALREETAQGVGNLGSLMAQTKISPRLGFRVGGVTTLTPDTFLVSAELCRPIPIMRFMVLADLIELIPKIFCIGWVTSADTNKSHPINIARTPLFRPSTTVVAATVLTEISFFRYFFIFL